MSNFLPSSNSWCLQKFIIEGGGFYLAVKLENQQKIHQQKKYFSFGLKKKRGCLSEIVPVCHNHDWATQLLSKGGSEWLVAVELCK